MPERGIFFLIPICLQNTEIIRVRGLMEKGIIKELTVGRKIDA